MRIEIDYMEEYKQICKEVGIKHFIQNHFPINGIHSKNTFAKNVKVKFILLI